VLKELLKKGWIVPGATLALAVAFHSQARAEGDSREDLANRITQGISKQYPGAKITLNSQVHWTRGTLPEEIQNVSLLGETSRGEMMFSVTSASGDQDSQGWVSFGAWMPARVASKRVHPGEHLSADMFTIQNVNVAVGQAHDLRGVILEPETPVANLEARQSVLEGQILLSSAVQHVPDVRRGDSVRVQLLSNGLSLSTVGVAEEPAYVDGQVHVTASKTKRQLVGKLLSNGVVEVKL
jgi:flagella basal body P-ring formation protein FlgA